MTIEARLSQALVLLGAALERIGELEQRLHEWEQQNGELQARLGQNSTNSSRPPSTDEPGTPRPVKREVTGRPPEGQVGHEKHARELVPAEQVSQVVEVMPERCEGGGRRLAGEDEAPQRY
jgi:transposase